MKPDLQAAALAEPARWTGLVRAHENGGFVAYGDYLKLLRKYEALAAAPVVAKEPVARLERRLEVLAYERDHARARYERTAEILVGIHALLYPPRFEHDGKVYEFRSPIVAEQMQALSDRIRAIPDEIAAASPVISPGEDQRGAT